MKNINILLNPYYFETPHIQVTANTHAPVTPVKHMWDIIQSDRSFIRSLACSDGPYLKLISGNNLLIDYDTNKILVLIYKAEPLRNLLFSHGGTVVRISNDFITNSKYTKVFSSFKRYILNPLNITGALFEIALTQHDMKDMLVEKLTTPFYSNVTGLNTFKNTILQNVKHNV